MYLRKALAGNAPGYNWPTDGAVVEVHDTLAEELLRIPEGGFTVAQVPGWQYPEEGFSEVDPYAEFSAPYRDLSDPLEPFRDMTPELEPKRKGGRPPLPRDENGRIIRKTVLSE